MEQRSKRLPTGAEYPASGTPDLFVTGESLLTRAKVISQRSTEQVRELIQDTKPTSLDDDATGEYTPLPD